MNSFSIKHFAQLVYNHCGLDYLSNLDSLENKISRRLAELQLTSIWDYCKFLENDRREWDVAVEILTINETYFLREENQLYELRDVILPYLLTKKKSSDIKIWSAACSSGEEPYTLAMMIKESGILENHQVKIIATDINKKVLDIARKGCYNKNSLSFRRISEEYIQKYFIEKDNCYEVSEELKELVEFKHLNLLNDSEMAMQKEFDIIFCRNVLIYFDADTVKKVTAHFYHALQPDRFLFLGHSENISSYGIGFKSIYTPRTFYYKKEFQ